MGHFKIVCSCSLAASESQILLSIQVSLFTLSTCFFLQAICKFFISRSEQNPADSIDKYPFADQMKYKTGRYTRTTKVRISSKGPKASGTHGAGRTRDEENLGLTQEEIEVKFT